MTKPAAGDRHVVGVDVGGANLKYCSIHGQSHATCFPMWEQSGQLAEYLVRDLSRFASIDSMAVTMTGELADCFTDRAAGVAHIVDQVMVSATELGIGDVVFYGVDGSFYSAVQAKSEVDTVAAANWHALASFVAGRYPAATTMVDIGSTTTDIIPLCDGNVMTTAKTDYERLGEGSLVYVGCRRTPVCALVDHLIFAGTVCPVMNEVFATIDDARLLLRHLGEDAYDCDTADHRPRTIPMAANRLARMIGLDRRSVSNEAAKALADQVVSAASSRISGAFLQLHRAGPVVIAGHGADLLRLDPSCQVECLADQLGPEVSRCAPSLAVAWLYASRAGQRLV